MARLIDADVLFKAYENIGWYNNADRDEIAEKILLEQPTVDAVEVVRCKDCVYCKRFNDVWYLPIKRDELLCTFHVATYHTTENDFCSWGERRKGDKLCY